MAYSYCCNHKLGDIETNWLPNKGWIQWDNADDAVPCCSGPNMRVVVWAHDQPCSPCCSGHSLQNIWPQRDGKVETIIIIGAACWPPLAACNTLQVCVCKRDTCPLPWRRRVPKYNHNSQVNTVQTTQNTDRNIFRGDSRGCICVHI